jgi:hypothetical protein
MIVAVHHFLLDFYIIVSLSHSFVHTQSDGSSSNVEMQNKAKQNKTQKNLLVSISFTMTYVFNCTMWIPYYIFYMVVVVVIILHFVHDDDHHPHHDEIGNKSFMFVSSYFVPCHPLPEETNNMMKQSVNRRKRRRRTAATDRMTMRHKEMDYIHNSNNHNHNRMKNNDEYGYCPIGNTCCYNPHYTTTTTTTNHSSNNKDYNATQQQQNTKIASCIPNDLGSDHATCCYDENDNHRVVATGCGVGYTCERINHVPYCFANPQSPNYDPLVQILPRYQLCHTDMLLDMIQHVEDREQVEPISTHRNDTNHHHQHHPSQDPQQPPLPFQLYGLPVGNSNAVIPYYSSHGAIDYNHNHRLDHVRIVIVVLHGANRNADDYFCSMVSAIYHHCMIPPTSTSISNRTTNTRTLYSMKNILIIAPRFSLSTDHDINRTTSSSFTSINVDDILQWDGHIINDTGGSWRYGANAILPLDASHISSFDVMDTIIETIRANVLQAQQIITIGHSSGGQFMQRWSLLTSIWDINQMKSIVMNPSSYVYLTEKRFMMDHEHDHRTWTIPNSIYCPQYNQWQFGLEPNQHHNQTYKVDYVNKVLIDQYHSNYPMLIERYRQRHIIYIIGEVDQCPISESDHTGYCNSHGLETSCADMLQGIHRYERHWNYYVSLQNIVYHNQIINHDRYTIPHIGHDHSLLFHSKIGLQVIFDPISIIV